MKINGYQIKESIKRWILQRDACESQFTDSLYAFETEEKDSPVAVMQRFAHADFNVARLQEIQQLYNSVVKCSVAGKEMTLSLCIKLIGGAGRQAKMWKEAGPQKRDRYGYRDVNRERNKDTDYAERQISISEALENFQSASKYASDLRNAISKGNTSEVSAEMLGLSDAEIESLLK